jgi:hypothetical protein
MKQQNIVRVCVVLQTLQISPTCNWRRDKQFVTDAAIQVHHPSTDAGISRLSVCACFSWSPSRSIHPWNIQFTNIKLYVIASFIFFEWRLSPYLPYSYGAKWCKKTTVLPKCILKRRVCDYEIGLWFWMNRDIQPLILNPSFQIPKIRFNFILTKSITLSYKDNFQGFSVIIWCQVIIKRNMKR